MHVGGGVVGGESPAAVLHSAPGAQVAVVQGERRYACCYCAWSGVDNWCLKRHLNTHLKPFACALCEYKAARAERLATHVHKVHNKKACAKCPFLADDHHQLALHLRDAQSVFTPHTTHHTAQPDTLHTFRSLYLRRNRTAVTRFDILYDKFIW